MKSLLEWIKAGIFYAVVAFGIVLLGILGIAVIIYAYELVVNILKREPATWYQIISMVVVFLVIGMVMAACAENWKE